MLDPQDQKNLKHKKPLSAIAVGFGTSKYSLSEIKSSLMELEELVYALDWNLVGSTFQKINQIKAGTLIGTGKIEEIKALIEETGAEAVVFDHALSGGQLRNLTKHLGVIIADRNQVIIDIFAKRAQTKEGKLQVELARLLDELPRMIGGWHGSLSRLGGGIGTRGPGESALESDRRSIRERIHQLKEKLEVVKKHRKQTKKNRSQSLKLALVGYTNAGKSSLLESLTGQKTYVEDQLFATLDPLTKKVFLPNFGSVTVTDTVGFINKIPTHLIDAFKATLEESEDADVLLHVIDASDPSYIEKSQYVQKLIEDFNWDTKPILNIYNKIDLLTETQVRSFQREQPFVLLSNQTGQGLSLLKNKIREHTKHHLVQKELFLPNSVVLQLEERIRKEAKVLKVETSQLGKVFYVELSVSQIKTWSEYIQ